MLNSISGTPNKTQDSGSPLDALGLRSSSLLGPDLLSEALEKRSNPLPSNQSLNEDERSFLHKGGRFDNVGARPKASDKFNDLKLEAKDKLKEKYKQERETILDESPKPENDAAQAGQVSQPGAQPAQRAGSAAAPSDPNQFNAFHSLNDELYQTRQQLQTERQQLAQERQQMINWYQQQQAQPKQAQAPAVEDEYFASQGIDPEMLKAYSNKVLETSRQEQQQFYQQFIFPQHVAQEQNRLDSAINHLKAEFPNFLDVIPLDRIKATQIQIINQHGLGVSQSKNWEHELKQAYKAVHYDQLRKDVDEKQKQVQKELDSKEKKLKEQKAKLAAVPRATHEGGNSGGDWQKAIDRLPSSMSMGAFGREVAHMLGRRH